MIENLLNAFRKDSLFAQAVDECHTMLGLDWTMYEASTRSLRHSDTGELDLDMVATDKRVNAYERDVRKKVLTHLAVANTTADLPYGLVLVTIVIDIERIGDYTVNIYRLAQAHPRQLQAGTLEPQLQEVEAGVTQLFRDMIPAFKSHDQEKARELMKSYKQELAAACDRITFEIVSGAALGLPAGDAAAVALYARYLKRIASHSRNVLTSIVNPFHRIGYREKPDVRPPSPNPE
jgi:phosphate uptake regulator